MVAQTDTVFVEEDGELHVHMASESDQPVFSDVLHTSIQTTMAIVFTHDWSGELPTTNV